MKKLVVTIAAWAALTMLVPVVTADVAAAKDKARSTEGAATSSRAAAEGAASGEKGAGMSGSPGSQSQMQAWDETYRTDKAQEQQLKAGGTSH